jgi:hypothetical protein
MVAVLVWFPGAVPTEQIMAVFNAELNSQQLMLGTGDWGEGYSNLSVPYRQSSIYLPSKTTTPLVNAANTIAVLLVGFVGAALGILAYRNGERD